MVLVLVAVTSLGGTTVHPTHPQNTAASPLETSLGHDPTPWVADDTPYVGSIDVGLGDRGGASQHASRSKPADPPPSKIDVVIAFALAQRGKPYRFGAAGPNAYDCSGLLVAAFARIGVHLPHYTGSMIAYGKRISRGDMRRGDIVFVSSGHVGIYLGDGMMVVAPHTGTVVRIQAVYSFYAARRIG